MLEEEGIFTWMDRIAVFLIISNKMLPSSGRKHLYTMPSITLQLQKQHCHSDIHQPLQMKHPQARPFITALHLQNLFRTFKWYTDRPQQLDHLHFNSKILLTPLANVL